MKTEMLKVYARFLLWFVAKLDEDQYLEETPDDETLAHYVQVLFNMVFNDSSLFPLQADHHEAIAAVRAARALHSEKKASGAARHE